MAPPESMHQWLWAQQVTGYEAYSIPVVCGSLLIDGCTTGASLSTSAISPGVSVGVMAGQIRSLEWQLYNRKPEHMSSNSAQWCSRTAMHDSRHITRLASVLLLQALLQLWRSPTHASSSVTALQRAWGRPGSVGEQSGAQNVGSMLAS